MIHVSLDVLKMLMRLSSAFSTFLKSTVAANIETESDASVFFLFSSFPSFHSLYFLLFLFCWCDFLASETPAKTPFGQMVAIFSQLDFSLMVCIVLLFEVSFYYYPIAEFKINPQTYLTTPKLRNCIFFFKTYNTPL